MDKAMIETTKEYRAEDDHPFQIELVIMLNGEKRFLSFFFSCPFAMSAASESIHSIDSGMLFIDNAKTWLDCMEGHCPKLYSFSVDEILSVTEIYG